MHYFYTIIGTLSACYLCLILFALIFADKMIFPAPSATYSDTSFPLIRLPVDNVGDVYAVYLPNEQADYTLFYCHGNAEDLGSIYPLLQAFHKRGLSVFAFDYPGYGLSAGKPSESACIAATNAAYVYLKTFHNITPDKVIVYGRSLGGGPAVELASREMVGGLILDGTFTSTFRVVTHKKILPWDVFNSIARIHLVKSPLLVIHGEQDATVPFKHGVQLYANAGSNIKQNLWVENAGHNNLIEVAGDCYWEAIDTFRTQLPQAATAQ